MVHDSAKFKQRIFIHPAINVCDIMSDRSNDVLLALWPLLPAMRSVVDQAPASAAAVHT